MICPLFGVTGAASPTIGASARVAESGGEHDALARDRRRAPVCSAKPSRARLDARHAVRRRVARSPRAATPACSARSSRSGLQSPSSAHQRAADDVGADRRRRFAATPARSSTSIGSARNPGCASSASHPLRARVELVPRTGTRARRPAGAARRRCRSPRSSSRGEPRPLARRALRPRAVRRQPERPCPAPRSGRSCRARRGARHRLRRAIASRWPRSRRPNAIAAPTSPPPTIATSNVASLHPRRAKRRIAGICAAKLGERVVAAAAHVLLRAAVERDGLAIVEHFVAGLAPAGSSARAA